MNELRIKTTTFTGSESTVTLKDILNLMKPEIVKICKEANAADLDTQRKQFESNSTHIN